MAWMWSFLFTGFIAVALSFRLLEIDRRLKMLEARAGGEQKS